MGTIIFKLKRNIGADQMKWAVGNDILRPTMTGAIIAPKYSEICCTDAHVLVRYPIEIISKDTEDSVSVPLFIFDRKHYYGFEKPSSFFMTDFIYKVDTIEGKISVHIPNKNNNCDINNIILKTGVIEGTPPNYMAVIPPEPIQNTDIVGVDLEKMDKIRKACKEPSVVSLNPHQTFKIALTDINRCILLEENIVLNPIKALLMPIMLNI